MAETDTAPDTTDEPARAVKFVAPDTIEGLAMPFGYDVDGETFTPDTDFCFDWFGKSGRPFLYDHGLDGELKSSVQGRQVDYDLRPEGVWARVQLDRNARYRKAIDSLIDEGALGFSAGAMPHLATKSARGEIKRFPWVELSGTPIPAHPATLGLHWVKSADAIRHLEEVDFSMPASLKAALIALDEWAEDRDDDGLHAGLKFADHADRLLTDVTAFRDRTGSIALLRGKSGRVLSASTRERLMRHPALLRELADDLDGLLSAADADKAAKHADLAALSIESEALRARLLGVPLSQGDHTS